MVKVLENKLVDLDVMPGAKNKEEAQQQATQQAQQVAGQLSEQAQEKINNLPPEAQEQIRNATDKAQELAQLTGIDKEQFDSALLAAKNQAAQGAGGFAEGAQNVAMGTASTVGGALKGVGDTLGNTVSFLCLTLRFGFVEGFPLNPPFVGS